MYMYISSAFLHLVQFVWLRISPELLHLPLRYDDLKYRLGMTHLERFQRFLLIIFR